MVDISQHHWRLAEGFSTSRLLSPLNLELSHLSLSVLITRHTWPPHLYQPAHFSQPGSPCLVGFRTLRSLCEERPCICARAARRKISFFSPSVTCLPETRKKIEPARRKAHTDLSSFTSGLSASMWGSPSTTSRPTPQIHSSRNARARASEPTSVPRDVLTRTAYFYPAQKVSVDDVARSVSARGQRGRRSYVRARPRRPGGRSAGRGTR